MNFLSTKQIQSERTQPKKIVTLYSNALPYIHYGKINKNKTEKVMYFHFCLKYGNANIDHKNIQIYLQKKKNKNDMLQNSKAKQLK